MIFMKEDMSNLRQEVLLDGFLPAPKGLRSKNWMFVYFEHIKEYVPCL